MNEISNLKVDDIRIRQQRLLLLHHAAKCEEPEGCCLVTRHCTEMKKLWNHIKFCQDKNCITLYCVSSRVVLLHYHQCIDIRCKICKPVRKVVKRIETYKKEATKQREFEKEFEVQLRLQNKQQLN